MSAVISNVSTARFETWTELDGGVQAEREDMATFWRPSARRRELHGRSQVRAPFAGRRVVHVERYRRGRRGSAPHVEDPWSPVELRAGRDTQLEVAMATVRGR